jgi:hypothetical protein
MKFHYVLVFMFISLVVFTNCGEDSEEAGGVQGTVTDKETGDPIQDAAVNMGGKVALTEEDGKYALSGISFSDKIGVVVTAANYETYKDTIPLNQELLLFDISLAPADGDVHGTVTDKETGDPIEGATVEIGSEVTLTEPDGKYALKGLPFSDRMDVVVTAADYREYNGTISLDRELLLFNISLVRVESLAAQILDVLEAFSRDIEALEQERIPAIQSRLSEDYTTGDNEVTVVGVFAGVIPPNYDGLPDTIRNLIDKYDKLEFRFVDPDVEFTGDLASVLMRFEVYAETKAKPPVPAKKWEIAVDGRLDLRKQDGDWKIIYWELVSDFLKFEEKPL